MRITPETFGVLGWWTSRWRLEQLLGVSMVFSSQATRGAGSTSFCVSETTSPLEELQVWSHGKWREVRLGRVGGSQGSGAPKGATGVLQSMGLLPQTLPMDHHRRVPADARLSTKGPPRGCDDA